MNDHLAIYCRNEPIWHPRRGTDPIARYPGAYDVVYYADPDADVYVARSGAGSGQKPSRSHRTRTIDGVPRLLQWMPDLDLTGADRHRLITRRHGEMKGVVERFVSGPDAAIAWSRSPADAHLWLFIDGRLVESGWLGPDVHTQARLAKYCGERTNT